MNTSQSLFIDTNDWALIYQNLEHVETEQLSSKLQLHFKTLPNFNDFIKLYESSRTESLNTWSLNEELFLQLIVLCVNPKCIKNRFDWERVQELMPNRRSLSDLCFKFQSFYKTQLPRQPWSSFEDKTLLNIIINNDSRCKKKWTSIANQYNLKCKSEIFRNAKQCRERWNNKLDPSINREPWSKFEELNFLYLLLQNGHKWAEISMKLSMITNYKRRTEFALKHKFKQLKKYYGQKAKKKLDFQISSYWNIQEVDMIVYKIELLQEKKRKCQTQEYSFCEFLSCDNEYSLVIIKKGFLIKL